MKNNYVFVIDENGQRVTSIVNNRSTKDELVQAAKQAFPNYPTYLYVEDGDSMLNDFFAGKIYKNGKLVDAPVYEPTAAELKSQKVAQIKEKYDAKFEAYEKALLRARLANNEVAVQKVQESYNQDRLAMAKEIKEA